MCGIVGIMNFNGRSGIDQNELVAMRDTMIHRGPDGAGAWTDAAGRLGLGHRRLSIIDLSDAAAQPMHSHDGRISLVFNGEIYNHAELRAELQQLGHHHWKTDHSDTEVIINAYLQWGIDCIKRFRGMFAIALWDDANRELWLVRDRLGVKPLYWTIADERLLFASEIKALLESPGIPRAINEEAVFHYLTFMTTPAPQTMFAGIQKLRPGARIRVTTTGLLEEDVWWDPFDTVEKDHAATEAEWAQRIREELETAVRYRAVSDVPVGVFLSGGIDSSTNTALFSRIADGGEVKTFTIGYENSATYSNEHEYARLVSRQCQTDHHELNLTHDDLVRFLPKMIFHQDEPIADPVCIPVYYVSKLARDHGVTVAQVGEGADELFWGYPFWKIQLQLQKLNDLPVPRWLKRLALKALEIAGKDETIYYELLRRGASAQRVFWGGVIVFTERAKQKILSPRMRANFSGRSSYEVVDQFYAQYRAAAKEHSDLDWMSYIDLRFRLPELLLMRVDKMSMATSIEGRVPFLDYKFVHLALSIPEKVKTRNGILKYILKKAVRGLIPDMLIDRRKQGFGIPVTEWMVKHFAEEAKGWVSEFCRQTDLLDEARALALIDRGDKNAWYIINLALWWKQYIATPGPVRSTPP
jgi:asparagine synthase (glutamine-hydrolysing)